MTTGIDIDAMIRSAMAAGIVHSLIPRETADLMRARLDELTGGHPSDGCLLCTVRQMTEGTPETWNPGEPATVTGVVLRTGTTPVALGADIPFVDLWVEGTHRTRIMGFGTHIQKGLEKAAPQVGDTLTVEYLGHRPIPGGKFAGRPYRHNEVSVKRGHH